MTDYEDTKLTDCAILNFWWTSNYGAILTAYALQQVLNDIGITSQLVNYQYGYKKKLYKNSLFEDFANKYLITSKKISNKKDFEILGKSVKTFIVGSDQVFNTYMTRNRLNEHLLGFADMFSKRIAMSARFKSLFEALKIPTAFLFNHINDVNLQDDIFNNIDYNQINNVCHAIKQDAYKKIELMVKSPKTISNDALAAQLNILRNNNFKQKIKNKNFMPISVIKTENNFIMNFFGIKLSLKRK